MYMCYMCICVYKRNKIYIPLSLSLYVYSLSLYIYTICKYKSTAAFAIVTVVIIVGLSDRLLHFPYSLLRKTPPLRLC